MIAAYRTLLFLGVALVAVACGSSADDSGADAPTAATTQASTSPESDAGATASGDGEQTTAPDSDSDPADSDGTDSDGTDPDGADSDGTGSTAEESPPTTTDESAGESPTTSAASADEGSRSDDSTRFGESSGAALARGPVVMRIRLDRRVDDDATLGFEEFVESVLTDEQGWTRAGFEFTFSDTDYDYTVVLAEGSEVDELCLPYDTFGRFSCQIGPVVALNADRWRTAVESWPVSLDEYRTMLVNHEVGHLLGQHHPAERCPGAGQPAPVMAQQSSGVAPCAANPWPLPWEIVCATQGVEPIAPGFERDITLTCGPDGPIG